MVTNMENNLTPAEAKSLLWLKVVKILEKRLETHRVKNEGDLDVAATAKLRGRIAELKFLLELGQDQEPAITTDANE